MGDIHGQHAALVDCLKQVSFDRKNDRLIQLGDICDGGDNTLDCVEELLTIDHLVAIRGNHDAWFLEFIETEFHPVSWAFGGHKTAIDYMRQKGKEKFFKKVGTGYKTGLSAADIPPAHRQFFKNQLPYYIDAQNRCFVHGGFRRLIDFFEQRPENYYWDRELWCAAVQSKSPLCTKPSFDQIFLGHTPTLQWNKTVPLFAHHIVNLDTGAGGGGNLTIMNVDTMEWVQSHSNGQVKMALP
jgi:serine/threonine protein phosphatase 1